VDETWVNCYETTCSLVGSGHSSICHPSYGALVHADMNHRVKLSN